MRGTGIGCFLDLVRAPLGERNSKQTDKIVIGSLDCHVCLDESLPLADKRAQLVSCEVQAMEVGETVFPLDLVDTELDFAKSVILIVLQISEGRLENTASKGIIRILQTTGTINDRLSNTLIQLVIS